MQAVVGSGPGPLLPVSGRPKAALAASCRRGRRAAESRVGWRSGQRLQTLQTQTGGLRLCVRSSLGDGASALWWSRKGLLCRFLTRTVRNRGQPLALRLWAARSTGRPQQWTCSCDRA